MPECFYGCVEISAVFRPASGFGGGHASVQREAAWGFGSRPPEGSTLTLRGYFRAAHAASWRP